MWQMILRGGWLMIPIFLCSIFALAIIFERIFFYSSIKFSTKKIVDKIFEYVRKNRISEALGACEKNIYYVTNILKAGKTTDY